MTTGGDQKRKETAHPNIFLYPHGVFYFRGHFNGTLVEKTLKTNQYAVAKKRAMALLNSLTDQDLLPGGQTVGALWPKFLATKEDKRDDGKILEATVDEYQWLWDTYLKFFEACKMRDLGHRSKGPELWRDFKKKYRHLNMANMKKAWLAFLRWCQKEGHLAWVMTCEIPEYDSRAGKALNEDERVALLMATDSRPSLKLFCLMYLLMAMRRSEITQAAWDQINFEESWILTKKRKSKTKPPRIVPLHPWVLSILTQRKAVSSSPYVFPNRDDDQRPMDPGGFKRAWAAALEDAGLKGRGIQMHDLRRTWETEAQQRAEFTDIQREKFAGHSSKVAKDRYTKFSADHLRPLVEIVSVAGLEMGQGSTWEKPGKRSKKKAKK